MLIAMRRPAFGLFAPVTLLAFGAAISVAAVERVMTTPSLGSLVATLFALTIAAFILSLVRVIWRSGDTLVVRGFFFRETLIASRTSFFSTRKLRIRSRDYEIEAFDGKHRVQCFSVWSRIGADHTTSQLARITGEGDPKIRAREEARRARIQGAETVTQAQAEAEVHAYYQAPVWRRTGMVLVGFVAIYVLGMSVYVATR